MDKLENIGFYTLTDYRAKNTSINSRMWRCEMIINEYCNFKCPYCRGIKDDIWSDKVKKQLKLDEIKKNIDCWCEGEPLKNIRFSGGEPTLHPDILEIVSYAKYKKIERIAISTNGSNKLELYTELVNRGVNDFSISLDSCCAEDGDFMSGGISGSWDMVVNNIKVLSKISYVTVGVVLTPDNVQKCVDTIIFAHDLGVSDIRIISSAQWNEKITGLEKVPHYILDSHPILKYRINRFIRGINVRGISDSDSHKCGLVMDDSIIAGMYHYPCVIYFREGGDPIGIVNEKMREERINWYRTHNCFLDEICNKNCLDICIEFNNKIKNYQMPSND